MPSRLSIAVIADAHFHDLDADHGLDPADRVGGRASVITLADTARSTRIFNESGNALRAALDAVVARGIRLVVLVGDYSDDGQMPSVEGVSRLLAGYARDHGMRFLATVGNHDVFAGKGRHITRRFIGRDGGEVAVTSDPSRAVDGAVLRPSMACLGTPDGLAPMAGFGFRRDARDLHWETPFGASDAWADRAYEMVDDVGERHRLIDASYLVEPVEGVWILMIDANVFAPLGNGRFADSTAAGWTTLPRWKPFLIDWIADVAARARAAGKQLLAFSHYPVLDPIKGAGPEEQALLGPTILSQRVPPAEVGAALARAGLRLHFSGHLHLSDTGRIETEAGALVNVAVPSPVGYPCAIKLAHVEGACVRIEALRLDDTPLDPDVMAAYAREVAHRGRSFGGLMQATDLGGFLRAHLAHLVVRRYLKREWPQGMRALIQSMTIADLAGLALDAPVARIEVARAVVARRQDRHLQRNIGAWAAPLGLDLAGLQALPLVDLVTDWYALRLGGGLARARIAPERRALIDALIASFAGQDARSEDDLAGFFARFMRLLARALGGLPDDRFDVDLADGSVRALEPLPA